MRLDEVVCLLPGFLAFFSPSLYTFSLDVGQKSIIEVAPLYFGTGPLVFLHEVTELMKDDGLTSLWMSPIGGMPKVILTAPMACIR